MIGNFILVFISINLGNIFNLYLGSFKYFTSLFTLISLIIV